MHQYFRSYRSILGAISGVVIALPIVSYILPKDYAGYIFPPLGTFEPAARYLTVLVGAMASYLAYFLPRRKPALPVIICAVMFIASMILYEYSFTRFVRRVEIPSRNESVLVSIGTQRTEFATKNFPGNTDLEMLKQRGLGEEEVEKLWTLNSISLARLLLWAPYCGLFLFSLAALGIGIASEVQKQAP